MSTDVEPRNSKAERPRTTRRQLLKASAGGAALVWAVPVVEVIASQVAAAGSPPPPPPPGAGTNISWVALIFYDSGTGNWYIWSTGAGFSTKLAGYGGSTNIPDSSFNGFAFMPAPGLDGFTAPGPNGVSISATLDGSGDSVLSLSTTSGTPTTLKLEYVLAHGGAHIYNGHTGSVLVANGTSELGDAIPSSVTVLDNLTAATVGTTSVPLTDVVGYTGS